VSEKRDLGNCFESSLKQTATQDCFPETPKLLLWYSMEETINLSRFFTPLATVWAWTLQTISFNCLSKIYFDIWTTSLLELLFVVSQLLESTWEWSLGKCRSDEKLLRAQSTQHFWSKITCITEQ